MQKEDLHIYCGFDKTKPTIDKVINDLFGDYAQRKNIENKSKTIDKKKIIR